MKKSNSYSPEVRERAVRMVLENVNDYPSEWAAIESSAPKIGCIPQTGFDSASCTIQSLMRQLGL